MELEIEIMNEVFTKHHLRGLPIPLAGAFHFFDRLEEQSNGYPHNHPWSFTSYVLYGGYREKVFHFTEGGGWKEEIKHRKPGTAHYVAAECVHQIIELPAGKCLTLVIPGPEKKDYGFFQFTQDGIFYRDSQETDADFKIIYR